MGHINRLPKQTCVKSKIIFAATAIAAAMAVAAALASCVPWPNSPKQEITPISSATSITLPDLIVDSLQTELPDERTCAAPAADFRLHFVIRNQGNGLAGPFAVLVNGIQRQIDTDLAAGEKVEMTLDGYVENLVIEIDPANQVLESNEANNLFQTAIPSPAPPDICLPTPTIQPITKNALFTMEGHTGKVLSVDFSPDGNLVASGSVDNTIRLWKVEVGTLLRTMTGHPFPVSPIVFSPNGANLATGSPDGIIRIWSVSNGLLVRSLQAHGGAITDLQYTPDNRQLLSSAQDFTVRVWNSADGRLLRTIDEGMSVVTNLVSANNGKEIIWAEEDGSLKIMRWADGAWLNRWRGAQLPATSLAISPDGDLLVSGYEDGRIQVWSLPQGILLNTLDGHNGKVTSLAFDPTGKWLASSSNDASLRLWSISSQQGSEGTPSPATAVTLAQIYLGHVGHINQVAFSPKGGLLASAGDDGTVRLWVVPEN